MTREHALKLRAMIEKLSATMADEEAVETVELFPVWRADGEYATSDRVRYDGVLYRCLVNHTAQETWTPVASPSLWTKVLIPDANKVPEWEQPLSTNPYMQGDKVTYNGKTWVSNVDNNVWQPGVYGWTEV